MDRTKFFFDTKYNKIKIRSPNLPNRIITCDDTNKWIAAFPNIKEIMDISFSINGKLEREFQQLIARENNNSTISNETEYFVIDIEFSNLNIKARFDLLAVRWLASQRRNTHNCLPTFVELKYGDGALSGKAGLIKHLKDINRILSDKEKYESILQTMTTQFEQLIELGLIKFNQPSKHFGVSLNSEVKPEVIIVLANHNPRSNKLADILNSAEFKELNDPSKFDLKFFIASFAGYGFHNQCMLPITEFLKII